MTITRSKNKVLSITAARSIFDRLLHANGHKDPLIYTSKNELKNTSHGHQVRCTTFIVLAPPDTKYFRRNVEAAVTGPLEVVWKLGLDLDMNRESWR